MYARMGEKTTYTHCIRLGWYGKGDQPDSWGRLVIGYGLGSVSLVLQQEVSWLDDGRVSVELLLFCLDDHTLFSKDDAKAECTVTAA